MANFVTKKDGTKVSFDSDKIKDAVKAAAVEAEMEESEADSVAGDTAELVANSFADQEEVTSQEIRERILSELEVSAPSVAESWKRYEEGKGE